MRDASSWDVPFDQTIQGVSNGIIGERQWSKSQMHLVWRADSSARGRAISAKVAKGRKRK